MKSTVWAISPLIEDSNDYYSYDCQELIGNTSLCAVASIDELKIVVLYPKAKVLITIRAS